MIVKYSNDVKVIIKRIPIGVIGLLKLVQEFVLNVKLDFSLNMMSIIDLLVSQASYGIPIGSN